jgi:hypothetical protein
MTHPLSEAGTSAAELAVEILTTLAAHYEAQSIDTLSVAEKIRLDNAATHVRNVAAALIQPTPAETEGGRQVFTYEHSPMGDGRYVTTISNDPPPPDLWCRVKKFTPAVPRRP